MGFLERLENLFQGAIEGSANSVLRQKIKPVEIENQLEREMRDNSQPSHGGRIAPNNFTVWLHPDTFRETIAGVDGYNRHCELVLNQFASQQGYMLLHPRISVAFDTDAALGRRDVRVDANFDAASHSQNTPAQAAPTNVHTRTQVIQAAQPAQQTPASSWSLAVIRGGGNHTQHRIPRGEATVGRSRDCDIVLQDDRNTVSRQHAVFINHGHKLLVRDNGSKNGTRVNGNFVPYHVETVIADGSEITFGECVVRVHMEHDGEGW